MSAVCYLLHFSRPFGRARHYLGMTTNLKRRMRLHRKGQGAAILRAARAAGITWRRVRLWEIPEGYTPREYEIALKRRHDSPSLCPRCRKAARHG